MVSPNISTLNALYDNCSDAHQEFLPVAHQQFQELRSTLNKLRPLLPDLLPGDFLGRLISSAYRFINLNKSAPIPFNHPDSIQHVSAFQELNRHTEDMAPSFCKQLRAIENYMVNLSEKPDNPMLDKFKSIIESNETDLSSCRIGLVVNRKDLISAIDDLIDHLEAPGFYFALTPQGLSETKLYDSLIVFGQDSIVKRYPHVFTAPKSKIIYRIGYDNIRFDNPIQRAFAWIKNNDEVWETSRVERPSTGSLTSYSKEESYDEDIIPTVAKISSSRETMSTRHDTVEAQLIELDDGGQVYLPVNDPNGRPRQYQVLSTDIPGQVASFKVEISDMEPGMFLILRTGETGGDYIELVADMILAEKDIESGKIRDFQNHWKSLLESKVAESSLDTVSDELYKQGCSIANDVNVRNWLGPTISPRSDKDREVLMSYLGQSENIEEISKNMKLLQTYHRLAGMRISKILQEQAKNLEYSELEKTLTISINLSEDDREGLLSACSILEIRPQRFTVSYSQTQRIIRI